MSFTELNAVEYFIIHQLSGVNLNKLIVEEPIVNYSSQWKYKSASDLNRGVNEVLVEVELREALLTKATKQEIAEVIHKIN